MAKNHSWRFFKSARCVQVKLETGDDLAALSELDPKLWTALSAPTAGLHFDAPTLAFLDSDKDGRIRSGDALTAVDWMRARFHNLDFLFARKDEISLGDVDDSTDAGRALLASFKGILARAGRADASALSRADVTGTTDVFNAQAFNGDGVVTPSAAGDPDASAVLNAIIATQGAVRDRSGADGADQASASAFFADLAAYRDWEAAGADAAVLGPATSAAYAAYSAVAQRIDAYFLPPEDLPLVAADPTPSLPLTGNVHPLWLDRFRAFAVMVAAPVLGRAEVTSVTRAEWASIRLRMAPYAAWLDSKPAKDGVAAYDAATRASWLKDGKAEAAVKALIAQDLSFADEYARLVDCERALAYAAHLVDWLRSFVNQANLYDPDCESVFHSGVLYIDGRAASLCFPVADEAAHAALAEKSRCCLAYVKLSRNGAAREVCAVITAGSTAAIYPGRNGIFRDDAGNEWDAVIAKVVEAQVCLAEAFWSPWVKISGGIAEQLKKMLSAKQTAAMGKVTAGISAVPAATAPAPAAPAAQPNGAVLASSVAALGVGIGMLGAACTGIVGLVTGLPCWKVVAGVAAIVLMVSLPSVALAWFKLRARDLGAILNAGGWAVNRPLYFSRRLAREFTRRASLPMGACVARDPYSKPAWLAWLLAVVLAVAMTMGVCWQKGVWPFGCRKCADAACAAAPAVEPAADATKAEAVK